MRVLMIAACPLPWPRGTPIRIHRMAEALLEIGHDVHVATYPVGDVSIPVRYRIDRVGSPEMTLDTAPGPSFHKLTHLDPLLCARVRKLLDTNSFDVIHAHHYEGLIAGLLARRRSSGIPLVFDAHTLLASELPQYSLGLPRWIVAGLGERLDRWLPHRADHVIAVSDRMREWFELQVGIPGERISMIPNGVEHDHFLVEQAGVRQGAVAPTIVFAGNLAEYQGMQLLFEVFCRVREHLGNAKLVLVTDGDVDALMAAMNPVGIAGSVSAVKADYASLPARLAKGDVLVNPRVQCDGVPQKMLNYMAAGRGIVSFETSRGPLEDGRTGLVVADGDVAAFAAAILRLLREPELASTLGDAARREVVAHHGWRDVAGKVTAVYRRLVGSNA
jgi:glycosyltransferase involved in cell wall biosynthesis